MARKKKCNVMLIVLLALITLLVAYLIFNKLNGNERFTNVSKEDFDNMRTKNTCGNCSG